MELGFQVLYLVAGLGLIWFSSDRSVRYAMESARLLGLSGFAVGFIILSVSTGLPEAVTAIVSVFADAQSLSTGNIFGSNVANITLILGLTVLLTGSIAVREELEGSLMRLLILLGGLVFILMFLPELGLLIGILLVLIYAGVVFTLRNSSVMKKIVGQEQSQADEDLREEDIATKAMTLFKLVTSIFFVLVSSELIVNSSTSIATALGISEQVIGATIVAIGTGLPELSLEINAVKRKEYGLALGNIFGSILVNFTLVLGVLSIVSSVPLGLESLFSIQLFFLASAIIVYYFTKTRHEVTRKEGGILLGIFCIYIIHQLGPVSVL